MQKIKVNRRSILLLISTALVIVIACVGWLNLWGRHAPLFADFTGYTSSMPLNGSTVKEVELVRIKERGLDIWRFDYVQEYDSGVTVYQRKVESYSNPASCKGLANGNNGNYERMCVETPLKDGGRYSLWTTKYNGELSHIEVSARIDSTELSVFIPKEKLANFEKFDDWQQFFESMTPVNLTFVPYEKRETKTGG